MYKVSEETSKQDRVQEEREKERERERENTDTEILFIKAMAPFEGV